jgi:two-component system, cell cycle sensor histidine kinase and response regulator CckA
MKNDNLDNNLSELRQHAEEKVKEQGKGFAELTEMSHEEICRTVHELRVHQIELEMQNEELRGLRNEVEAARDKYCDLYDFAPVGYFTLDTNGGIQEVNLTGASLLGEERRRLFGTLFYRFISKEDHDVFYKHQNLVSVTEISQNCKLRMKKKDGVQFHARVKSIAVPGSRLIRTVVSDISEQVRLESRLRHAHKMQALGTMAGGFAHEFNNALFPIMGYTEMAISDLPENSETRRYLEKSLSQIHRAKDLIRRILDFSHQTDPCDIPFEIQSYIKNTVKMLRTMMPANIEFCEYIADNCGTVTGNPDHISQILINLCTNACHAMEDSGGKLNVNAEPVCFGPDAIPEDTELKPGRYIRLTVSDTGCGIATEFMGRIFDPYFTTKEIGKGTGLGLSIVHGIVRQQSGAITVNSELRKGTTVNVYLPVSETEVFSKPELSVETIPGGNERILLVDDEPMLVIPIRFQIETNYDIAI